MPLNTDELIRRFEENPIAFMAAAGTLLMGISKVVTAAGKAQGSRAYAKQVRYRIKHQK